MTEGADALVIATEWKEFRSPDFDRLKSTLSAGVIFDGRNLYDPAILGRFGFTYYAIGRGQSIASVRRLQPQSKAQAIIHALHCLGRQHPDALAQQCPVHGEELGDVNH